MKKFLANRSKKAQQLVEFMLVAPFMVIILGILTEYAYALNINFTLSNGIKEVTSSIYSEIAPGATSAVIQAQALADLTTYLADNNIPTKFSNNIRVQPVILGNTTVFVAQYTYIPAFTLPNIYFHFLPDEFNFTATAAVPSAFLDGNSLYSSGVTSAALDNIYSSDISSQSAFDSSKDGVMSNTVGRDNMIFLISTDASVAPGLTKPYLIRLWDGTLTGHILETTNGKLYVCGGSCIDTGSTFKGLYSAYTNIVFAPDSDSTWLNPNNPSGAIYASSFTGLLKRSISLSDTNGKSLGNYDNLDVSYFNSYAASSNRYNVVYSGGKIFVHTSADNISALR